MWARIPARNCSASVDSPYRPAGSWNRLRSSCHALEVHVGAVAGLVGPWLRRERGDQAAPGGDAANRLPDQHLRVCCGERRPGQHGQLVLPVAELGVVLVERDLLGVEGVDDRIDHLGTGRHPDGREAQAGVDGHGSFAVEVGQRELVLDGAAQLDPVLGEPPGHAGQEATGARRVRRVVEADVIDEHRRRAGRTAAR